MTFSLQHNTRSRFIQQVVIGFLLCILVMPFGAFGQNTPNNIPDLLQPPAPPGSTPDSTTFTSGLFCTYEYLTNNSGGSIPVAQKAQGVFPTKEVCESTAAPSRAIGAPVTCDCQTITSSTDTTSKVISTQNPAGDIKDKVVNGVWNFVKGAIMDAILEAMLLLNNVLTYLVGAAGYMLDAAITVTMAPFTDLVFLQKGWAIVRDVSNILFIFFLLAIAISMIVGYEKYGSKKLLAPLILCALLINFSLVISLAIIDFTNVVAIGFIRPIHPVSNRIATILSISSLKNTNFVHKDPPAAAQTNTNFSVQPGIKSGIQAQDFTYTPVDFVKQGFGDHGQTDFDPKVTQMFFQVLMMIMQLVVTFVMLGIALLLITRTVVLMALLVLAPFGFVFAVFPATAGLSSQWWSKLLKQAFFFPAAAFFLYLAIAFGHEVSKVITGGKDVTNLGMLFNFTSIIIFLCMALVMGNTAGIYGASTVINRGQKLAAGARNYARRGFITAPADFVNRRYIAPQASKLEAGTGLYSGAAGKMLRYVPGVQRGAAALAANQRATIEAAKKNSEHLTSDEIKRQLGSLYLSSTKRAAMQSIIAGRGDISYDQPGYTRERARRDLEYMRSVGMNVGSFERQDLGLVKPQSKDYEDSTGKRDYDEPQAMRNAQARVAKKMKAKDIENIDPGILKDSPEIATIIAENAGADAYRAIFNKTGPVFDKFRDALHNLVDTVKYEADDVDGIVAALEARNNYNAANYLRTTPGMKAYGFGVKDRDKNGNKKKKSNNEDEDEQIQIEI